jgi:aminopeptidase N
MGTRVSPCSLVTLTLTFTGELNDKLAGFYRSAYPAPDGSGETRHLAVTQFEPTAGAYTRPLLSST